MCVCVCVLIILSSKMMDNQVNWQQKGFTFILCLPLIRLILPSKNAFIQQSCYLAFGFWPQYMTCPPAEGFGHIRSNEANDIRALYRAHQCTGMTNLSEDII